MKKKQTYQTKVSNDKRLFEITDMVDKINSKDLTREEEILYYKLLERDKAAQKEFDVINAIWHSSSEVFKNEPIPEVQKVSARMSSSATGRLWEWLNRVNFSLPVRFAAVAATIMMVVAGIWFLQIGNVTPVMHSTATGEQKRIYLSDRSMIFLDSETELLIAFSEDLRRIELKTGRASFSVSQDPKRPFVVSAGEYSVIAVGTVFDVYKDKKNKLSVTVTEGRVQVSKDKKMAENPKKLSKILKKKSIGLPLKPGKKIFNEKSQNSGLIDSGQKLIAQSRLKAYEVKEVDTKTVDEWRSGRLIFRSTPFEDVVNEINRYLENKIVVADDHLKQLSTNFIFNIRDRRDFLAILEQTLPIVSKKTSNGKIIIQRKIN